MTRSKRTFLNYRFFFGCFFVPPIFCSSLLKTHMYVCIHGKNQNCNIKTQGVFNAVALTGTTAASTLTLFPLFCYITGWHLLRVRCPSSSTELLEPLMAPVIYTLLPILSKCYKFTGPRDAIWTHNSLSGWFTGQRHRS